MTGCPAREKDDFDAGSADFLPQSLVILWQGYFMRVLILESIFMLSSNSIFLKSVSKYLVPLSVDLSIYSI